MDEHEQLILGVIRSVARDKSPDLASVQPDQLLVEDLGLTSLDLAAIIAKLELKLGVDPFAQLVPVTSLRTAGDLCAAYAKCFSPEGAASDEHPQPPDQPTAPRPLADLAAQRALRRQAREE